MSAVNVYDARDLGKILGVRTRNIHFWVQSGLLSGPGSGRGARYSDEHLGRLFLVKQLRATGRSLPEIASALAALTTPEALVMAARALREWQKPRATADDVIAHWLGESRRDRAAAVAVPAAPALAPAQSASVALPSAGLSSTELPATEPLPMVVASGADSWTRVLLGDGVELHVRQPPSPEAEALVAALTSHARQSRP